MAIRSRYFFQTHRKIESEDLPALSADLQEDFWDVYKPILMAAPYDCGGFPSYSLTGQLTGCRALEIGWTGTAYRLIYRVYESPAPQRVLILSFDEHDPAYDKAKARTGRKR